MTHRLDVALCTHKLVHTMIKQSAPIKCPDQQVHNNDVWGQVVDGQFDKWPSAFHLSLGNNSSDIIFQSYQQSLTPKITESYLNACLLTLTEMSHHSTTANAQKSMHASHKKEMISPIHENTKSWDIVAYSMLFCHRSIRAYLVLAPVKTTLLNVPSFQRKK